MTTFQRTTRACPSAFLGLALCLVATCVGGCSSATSISGKVIRGDVSLVGAVDPKDPRLTSQGLGGAEVMLRGIGSHADRILGDAITSANGDFTIRIVEFDALTRPAEFKAHLAGYIDAKQEMPVPPSERRVLIVLKPGPTP